MSRVRSGHGSSSGSGSGSGSGRQDKARKGKARQESSLKTISEQFQNSIIKDWLDHVRDWPTGSFYEDSHSLHTEFRVSWWCYVSKLRA